MVGIIYNPPEGKDCKWYISGLFPANWGMDYATDPTLCRNLNNPLIKGSELTKKMGAIEQMVLNRLLKGSSGSKKMTFIQPWMGPTRGRRNPQT